MQRATGASIQKSHLVEGVSDHFSCTVWYTKHFPWKWASVIPVKFLSEVQNHSVSLCSYQPSGCLASHWAATQHLNANRTAMDTLSVLMLDHRIWPLAACCPFSPLYCHKDQNLDLLPKSITKSKDLIFVLHIHLIFVGSIFCFFLCVDLT